MDQNTETHILENITYSGTKKNHTFKKKKTNPNFPSNNI